MKIASFNINGIKARLPALLDWLKAAEPDIVVLQEIKSLDEAFPREDIEELGYNIHTYGQKSFNGVAILSKFPLDDIVRGLKGNPADEQARYIEASVTDNQQSLRLCGLYLPNGNPAPGPKYDYKLEWMARLEARVKELFNAEESFMLLGDFNVIPQSEDCWDEKEWEGDALYLPQTREAFQRIVHLGLTDALRATSQSDKTYTFFDYQKGRWQKNHGIRIDHILLSPALADRLEECQIDKDIRGYEKPSDHVPIWVRLNLE